MAGKKPTPDMESVFCFLALKQRLLLFSHQAIIHCLN
jgi:hypothetical protein